MKVVLGGTFDPVHLGHLRMAIELGEALRCQTVDLMPCYLAVHKDDVSASSTHRLAMLNRAISEEPGLAIDERELLKRGPSFTIDSLMDIRSEIGDEPLVLAMGGDSALQLESWYRSDELAQYAHIVVMERPGFRQNSKVLSSLGFKPADSVKSLNGDRAGYSLQLQLNLLQISSTYIRRSVREGKNIRYLVPDAVADYICDNGLYQQHRREVVPN